MNYLGIDPSTKTGIVRLDESGIELYRDEISGKADTVFQMIDLTERILDVVNKDDVISIEGFGYGSKQGFMLGGIGWILRTELIKKGIHYNEVAPTILKKFATGKGNADKRLLAVEVSKRWDFFDSSDNITDAYVLAQISRVVSGVYEKPTKAQVDSLKKVSRWA